MGDDSINMVILDFDMGYLVTLEVCCALRRAAGQRPLLRIAQRDGGCHGAALGNPRDENLVPHERPGLTSYRSGELKSNSS